MREDDRFDKCGKTETIEHIFLDCKGYAGSIWEKFRDLLQHCKSKPGVVNLSQDHIIYLKVIPILTKEENEETPEIIQELKQLIYGSRMDNRQVCDPIRIRAEIRKCIQQIVKLGKCNSKSVQFGEKLTVDNDCSIS